MIQVPQSLVLMIPGKCVIRLSSGVVVTFEKLFEQRTRVFIDTIGKRFRNRGHEHRDRYQRCNRSLNLTGTMNSLFSIGGMHISCIRASLEFFFFPSRPAGNHVESRWNFRYPADCTAQSPAA